MTEGFFEYKCGLLDLFGWPSYKPCYLPGNYWTIVLGDTPEYINAPLYIHLDDEGNYQYYVSPGFLRTSRYKIFRVIIEGPGAPSTGQAYVRYSNALILDFQTGEAFRFEPFNHDTAPHFNEVNRALNDFLLFDLGLDGFELKPAIHSGEVNLYTQHLNRDLCSFYGLATGYCLMYLLSFFCDRSYEPEFINAFMTKLVKTYPLDLEVGPPEEVEY